MTQVLTAAMRVQRGSLELDVEIDVQPGEVLAVLGPNGAGKSTVIDVLSGVLPLDHGTVRLGDRVLDGAATDIFVPPEQRRAGVVFQDYLLFDHLTVLENVAFGVRAFGATRERARETAREWLARVGMSECAAMLPRALSGGQAQRVALARALATTPAMLLLDEPLAAVDVASRRELRGELRRHVANFAGPTVLVTHDPVDAYALADRVAVLDRGRVVQAGTIAEVTARPRTRFVADLVGTNLVKGRCVGSTIEGDDGSLIAVVDAPAGEVFAVIAPQAIALSSAGAPSTSARNVWECEVLEVAGLGERARVSMRAAPGSRSLPGGSLTAEITAASVDLLHLRVGDRVTAAVKATEVQVYPA